MFNEISDLATEQNNSATRNIDISSVNEILFMINDEDRTVPDAVRAEISKISVAVDAVVHAFQSGGRLFYVGAGTSGRLGIVDASECPPTFGTDPEMVQGIIAGGDKAVFRAQEGAEDRPADGANIIKEKNICEKDVVCGLAASGRTPFVKGALEQAKTNGAFTIMISTVSNEKLKELDVAADLMICPNVGPEVIQGSTRMKSGTAQKLVLNMITTTSMVRLGKIYGNVMVDLQLTNNKLRERAKRILMTLGNIEYDAAEEYLAQSNGSVKTALVMILANVDKNEAERLVQNSNGFVKKAIDYKK
ncbi:MAG: N-acetylmuramic acid 6-phosphate etherase [Candidatus Kapabacteria bacterium]|nr:N-acetylmuramic acid 6-phosphate etherase [Candidatus Kapabacteria bacterium]